MKRLLSILAVFGVSAVGTTSVIACDKTESNNLSRVKTIAVPATVHTVDATKVTKDEIKKALIFNVLKAVQGVVKTAQETDFVFEVYADNKGKELKTVDLQASKVDVYVQITPEKDKTVVIGKSEYIKVTLPKDGEVKKVNISDLKVDEQNIEIKTDKPNEVLKNQLEAVNNNPTLVKAVLNVIQAKAAGVEESDFAIINNGDKDDYSSPKEIIVTVKANDSSAKITGQFDIKAKVSAKNS